MIATVDSERERTVAMLEKWVNQNSGTLNPAGGRGGRPNAARRARAPGLRRRVDRHEGGGRAGHLVARHKGNGRGKRMLLIGHLDTVFEPHSPFQRWERIRPTNPGW